MRIEPDIWLTSIFGHDVFRITDIEQAPLLSGEVFVRASEDNQVFFYAKIPVERVDLVRTLNASGFAVVDVNVTFECLPKKTENSPQSTVIIRDAWPEESDGVQDIAGTCFTHSRFHRDPNIPKDYANLVKREWVANYFKSERGERILVAELDAKPIGFLAIANIISRDESIRVIDLIGIRPEYQGKSVGRQLVDFFINDSIGKFNILRVGTQIANTVSLNLYERCGFHITDAAYVLHAHTRDGRVI